MNTPLQTPAPGQPKQTYQTPRLQKLGSVKKLTLKTGSNSDGFGGFS